MGIEALVLDMGKAMQKQDWRIERLEQALTNQEHTIREQEKDIVTLKLQVQALQDAPPRT